MLFTLRERRRTSDSALSRVRSKILRRHSLRLDSEALRRLQRWGITQVGLILYLHFALTLNIKFIQGSLSFSGPSSSTTSADRQYALPDKLCWGTRGCSSQLFRTGAHRAYRRR